MKDGARAVMPDDAAKKPLPDDDEPTRPRRPNIKYDVMIIYVPPVRRMVIIDALMKTDLLPDLTPMEALLLTFQLPSLPLHCATLQEARDLELILDVLGAKVKIRPAKYCAED
jgi:hypothetical protein